MAIATKKNTVVTLVPKDGKEGDILISDGRNSAIWKNAKEVVQHNMPIDIEDLLSYGIEWDINQKTSKCKRIGNLAYHKSLPIQSQMKGCVLDCINKKVVYWLDEDDWNFVKIPSTVLSYSNGMSSDGTYVHIRIDATQVNENGNGSFNYTRLKQITYVRINNIKYKVEILDVPAGGLTEHSNYFNILSTDTNFEHIKAIIENNEDVVVELGSILNGYDGEVFVHIPKYYIKSYNNTNNDGKKWVKISETKIDDSWTESPECYISAYFNVVPFKTFTNMGYLNNLNSEVLLSINNKTIRGSSYGGSDNPGVSANITQTFKTTLNKPTYVRFLFNYESSAKLGSKHVLNYTQYKNFVWLYCIEYANFDIQEDYIEELTPEGYRQGGLGLGCSVGISKSLTQSFNLNNPLIPCGYGDKLGNHSGITPANITELNKTINVPRYRGIDNLYGDREFVVIGISIYTNNLGQQEIKIINNPNNYTSTTEYDYKINYKYIKGYINDIDILENAEIISVNKVISNIDETIFGKDYIYNDMTSHNNDTRQLQIGGSPNDSKASGLFNFNISSIYNNQPYIKVLSIVTV